MLHSKAFHEVDRNGWTALHHALDSSSFCWRAYRAALQMLERVSPAVINLQTTGTQPCGYSCLHFACDGSGKGYTRVDLVRKLLRAMAEIDARDSKGNTPLLLASGVGVRDVCKVLVDAKANINATQSGGVGVLQKAAMSSGTTSEQLLEDGAPVLEWAPGNRTRTGVSDQRMARRMLS